MATSTQQRETLREMSPAELSALLDSATHCEMSIRDFRGSVVPLEDEPEMLFDSPDYVKSYPIRNWRTFLADHVNTGTQMQPGTANKDVLTLKILPSTTATPYREAVFSFTIPGLLERLARIYNCC